MITKPFILLHRRILAAAGSSRPRRNPEHFGSLAPTLARARGNVLARPSIDAAIRYFVPDEDFHKR